MAEPAYAVPVVIEQTGCSTRKFCMPGARLILIDTESKRPQFALQLIVEDACSHSHAIGHFIDSP